MSQTGQSLFNLLPALYRMKDAQIAQTMDLLSPAETAQLQALQAMPPPLTPVQQLELDTLTAKAARGPLQSLIMLIEEQLAIVSEDMGQLYDNHFIETCAPWVIPYIGDLIGYQEVNGVAPAVASPRAEVANTISYRRRKGTVLVLEQLGRDVTGWGAHAVEFFLRLADTQYMNHIRPHNYYAPNLRSWKPRAYMNTAFDKTAHKVDVRRIDVERGRYNIPNIGIFLWSLNAYSLTMAKATQVRGNPQCYRLSTLGRDIPIFNNPISQGAEITVPAKPENVPNSLLRHVLCHDIQQTTPIYYGIGNSLALYVDGVFLTPARILVCDLSGPDGSWANLGNVVAPYAAAIDPHLGRVALPAGSGSRRSNVTATYYYGFNADMGGGEYPRASTFTGSPEQITLRVPNDYATIQDALTALPGDGIVEVTSSGTYTAPSGLTVAVGANGHIELRAADGFRPTLVLGGEISVTGGADSAFDFNGFVVSYAPPAGGGPLPAALIHAPDGGADQLSHLGLTHCTLVPGWALTPHGHPRPAYANLPTLFAEPSGLQIVVQSSILGGMWVNGQATATLTDSIVDATDQSKTAYVATVDSTTKRPQPGGALTLQGCTVVGKVYASLLTLVSDSLIWAALTAADQAGSPPIWNAPLWASRQQQGCVRFSYIPANSVTPRQYDCVEQAVGIPQPLFYSLRYGDPAYCKYAPWTDDTIRRGADDGGEMGVYHFVLAPLRETDLRVRMQEYLPVGLEYGIFYET